MRRPKRQRSAAGWQQTRIHRRKDPGAFNLGLAENIPDDPDSDLDGPVLRKPVPRRPWHCPHCPARLAYSYTLDRHLLAKHAALLPKPQKPSASGPVKCRWCPNGYSTQAETSLHEQAFHARNLALDIGGYSTAGA